MTLLIARGGGGGVTLDTHTHRHIQYVHQHTLIHTCLHTHSYTHTHKPPPAQTHKRPHAHAHAHTHTDKHTKRAHTPTLRGLMRRPGWGPALCPGCGGLRCGGAKLCAPSVGPTRPLIGSVRSQAPSLQPPLPRGLLSPHILPADYHHWQTSLSLSSCCPHRLGGLELI